jgi:hypothetical protein
MGRQRSALAGRKAIQRRLRAGYGQGVGADYQPYLRVQDVTSSGVSHRYRGWKTGREYDLLSTLEWKYFLHLEWCPSVINIQEQFPLQPLEATLLIAEELGVDHPATLTRDKPPRKEPILMTTDFVITLSTATGLVKWARAVKPAAELEKEAVAHKLDIERVYWERKGINWKIVTEYEISEDLFENVRWIHEYLDMKELYPLKEDQIRAIARALTQRIVRPNAILADVGLECDDRLGFEPGTGLSVARHLIANRQWLVDMERRIDTMRPLVFLVPPQVEAFTQREET